MVQVCDIPGPWYRSPIQLFQFIGAMLKLFLDSLRSFPTGHKFSDSGRGNYLFKDKIALPHFSGNAFGIVSLAALCLAANSLICVASLISSIISIEHWIPISLASIYDNDMSTV